MFPSTLRSFETKGVCSVVMFTAVLDNPWNFDRWEFEFEPQGFESSQMSKSDC